MWNFETWFQELFIHMALFNRKGRKILKKMTRAITSLIHYNSLPNIKQSLKTKWNSKILTYLGNNCEIFLKTTSIIFLKTKNLSKIFTKNCSVNHINMWNERKCTFTLLSAQKFLDTDLGMQVLIEIFMRTCFRTLSRRVENMNLRKKIPKEFKNVSEKHDWKSWKYQMKQYRLYQ